MALRFTEVGNIRKRETRELTGIYTELQSALRTDKDKKRKRLSVREMERRILAEKDDSRKRSLMDLLKRYKAYRASGATT